VALVRVLLLAAVAAIVVALFLYALKRDRRYLRFVAQVGKFTIAVLLAILLGFAVQRIFGISFGEGLKVESDSAPQRFSLPAPQRLFERAVG